MTEEMTEFELWIKACEEYGTCICTLGGYGDTAIYKTYKHGKPCPETNWDVPIKDVMYHVWIRGKRPFVSTAFSHAWAFWTRERGY